MKATTTIFFLLLPLVGCLYNGEGTKGLPCNVDADCSAQYCVEGVCGGPDAADSTAGSDGSGGSDASEGEQITEQMFPEPCVDGHTECLDSNSMSLCEDGKLMHFQCEAWCGMDNPVEGGCQADPRNDEENCWCASSGGPPSGTCQQPCSFSSDCSSGETCLDIIGSGNICMPSSCEGCFSSGLSCFSYPDSCKFDHCE